MRTIFYQDGFQLFYDLNQYFSLENVLKRLKCKESRPIYVMALIVLEMILIIEKLHQFKIIHTNISTSNIILFKM